MNAAPLPMYSLRIRNVRYVPYFVIAQSIWATALIVLVVTIGHLTRNNPNVRPWISGGLMGGGVCIALAAYIALPQLRRVSVGRWLELHPQALGRRFYIIPANQLRQLVLMDDPQQNYADDEMPHVVLVHLDSRQGRRYKLFCSTADLDHLRTWAHANSVPVEDQREQRDA